jgi:hypothetical protein
MTDCRPEPHTRLTIIAPTVSGTPPRSAAWRAGACQACRQDAAQDYIVDVARLHAAALQRGANRNRPKLGGLQAREPAHETPNRRPRAAYDHGRAPRISHAIYSPVKLLLQRWLWFSG